MFIETTAFQLKTQHKIRVNWRKVSAMGVNVKLSNKPNL
jgi:sporulation protein YlmC with PRC-barrel domain